MDEPMLRDALKKLDLPEIHYFDKTDSTNERALALIARGAPDRTLVIAEQQTAGRGRNNRQWDSTEGASLTFSLILRPVQEELDKLVLFSLLGALAVCQAIERCCKINPEVKWPNDILLNRKKTAGVLAEGSWRGSEFEGLALGIGINLLAGSEPPPDLVMYPATCVASHCGKEIDRYSFLSTVLHALLSWLPKISSEEFITAYRSRLAFVGQTVELIPGAGETITGKMAGITNSGEILLTSDNGISRAFPIGDMKLISAKI